MKKNILAAILVVALLAIPVAAHVSGNEQVLYATEIAPNTEVSALDGLSVLRGGQALSADDIIATNDIIVKDGREYIAAVKGDVNGDGAINSTDFMQVRRVFLGLFSVTGAAAKAADVNGDGAINSTDFMQIRRHYLELYTITGEVVFGQPVSIPTSSTVSTETEASSETTSSEPVSSAASSKPTSTYSIEIGPGKDESGWGPIF